MCSALLRMLENWLSDIKKALLSSVDYRAKAIGVIGFGPTASCSQSRRSSQAELHPGNSGTAARYHIEQSISHTSGKVFYTRRKRIAIESCCSV